MSTQDLGKNVAQVAWDACEGAAREALIALSSKWLRDNVFTPPAVLEAMDRAGGTLGYEGVEILRAVETLGKRYYRGSILPCKADLQRAAAIVEAFGSVVVPWTPISTVYGEGVEFDNEKAVRAIVEAYGLTEEAARRSISIAQSTDAFQISKRITCLMGGIKMQDHGAICPFTGKPIIAEDPKDSHAQSRNHCFPLNNPIVGWKPLKIAINTDMSAAWKLLNKGGGSNNTRCPCINCAIINDDLASPNPVRCNRFCNEHHRDTEGWLCYHHDMLDDEKIKEMQEEMLRVSALLTCALDDLERRTKIPKREHPTEPGPTSKTNMHSIHFLPTNAAEKQAYSAFITDELLLRNLPIDGDMVARRQRLREALGSELTSRNLTHQIGVTQNPMKMHFS